MSKLYKDFTITGVASATTFDGGIESTEAEKKRVVGVLINLSGHAGNILVINIDREKIAGIPDYLLDTDADTGSTSSPLSDKKMQFIELDHELDQGRTLQVGIKCGGTAKDVRGAYVYELI